MEISNEVVSFQIKEEDLDLFEDVGIVEFKPEGCAEIVTAEASCSTRFNSNNAKKLKSDVIYLKAETQEFLKTAVEQFSVDKLPSRVRDLCKARLSETQQADEFDINGHRVFSFRCSKDSDQPNIEETASFLHTDCISNSGSQGMETSENVKSPNQLLCDVLADHDVAAIQSDIPQQTNEFNMREQCILLLGGSKDSEQINTKKQVHFSHVELSDDVESLDSCLSVVLEEDEKPVAQAYVSLRFCEETFFCCRLCDFACDREDFLSDHILTHNAKNTNRQLKCDLCSFTCRYKRELLRHMTLNHNREKPFQCISCDYSSFDKTKLTNHIFSKHSTEKPFKCELCDYASVYKKLLRQHIMSKHDNVKPFKCDFCDFCSVRKDVLSKHILAKHNTEKWFQCKYCCNSTTTEENLLEHIKTEHGDAGLVKCASCNFICKRKDVLIGHIFSKHRSDKPFKCEFCNHESTCRKYLLRHIKSTHDDKKTCTYKCDSCDYSSKIKGSLTLHVLSKHKDDKPFQCEYCSYKSTCRKYLLRHVMSKHENEKRFKCGNCDYTATRKCQLSVHIMANHSGQKPFKCDICNYTAVEKNRLLKHIMSNHLDQKPFKCQFCDYSTVRKYDLTRHISSKHNNSKPEACDVVARGDNETQTTASSSDHNIVQRRQILTRSMYLKQNQNTNCEAISFSSSPKNCNMSQRARSDAETQKKNLTHLKTENDVGNQPDLEMRNHNENLSISGGVNNDVSDFIKDETLRHETGHSVEESQLKESVISKINKRRSCDKNITFKMTYSKPSKRKATRTHELASKRWCRASLNCSNEGLLHLSPANSGSLVSQDMLVVNEETGAPAQASSEFSEATSFCCHLCDFRCDQEELSKHVKSVHKGKRQFKCDACSFIATSQRELLRHQTSIHNREKPFQCASCDYSSVDKYKLTKHISSKHAKEKPFKCELCVYTSADKKLLHQHIMSKHDNLKPFKCVHCGYSTVREYTLARHVLARHVNLQQFECQFCGFKTAWKENLHKHIRAKHTNERRYKCESCEYSTERKDQLARHAMAKHSVSSTEHTTEKPFKCYMCGYSTARESNLTRHVLSKHGT